jgi:hypothetical protein
LKAADREARVERKACFDFGLPLLQPAHIRQRRGKEKMR